MCVYTYVSVHRYVNIYTQKSSHTTLQHTLQHTLHHTHTPSSFEDGILWATAPKPRQAAAAEFLPAAVRASVEHR